MKVTINREQVNQEFFVNFNWNNFQHGDIVWLEDCDDTEFQAAYFSEVKDETVTLFGLTNEQYLLAVKYELKDVYPMF